MMSTFIDTIIVCTMTGLVIIVTGAWNSGVSGAALTSNAFAMALPGFGQYFLAIALAVFAYHPRLGLLWRKCWEYLAGTAVEKPYRVLWTLFVMIGAITHLDFVWLVADTLNAVMAFPNLVSLVLLSPVVVKINNEYFASRMADAVARRATGAGEPAGNRPPGAAPDGHETWAKGPGRCYPSCVRGAAVAIRRSTRKTRPAAIAKAAAPNENSAPILAASCTGPGGKATLATKSETVKPIAATQPTTKMSRTSMPSGMPKPAARRGCRTA